MKTKLIQTEYYLLLIDEEGEIKEDNYFVSLENNLWGDSGTICKLTQSKESRCLVTSPNGTWWVEAGIKWLKESSLSSCQNKLHLIIAYYPLTEEAKELDLPLLPNPFEDDSESLFDKVDDEKIRYSTEESDLWVAYRNGFKDCYEAQSKQFSLQDMKKAFEEGEYKGHCQKGRNERISYEERGFKTFDELIKSLSTQQLPISFEPEYSIAIIKRVIDGTLLSYPKKELKTIINSENKEVLVGTYKY